MRRASGPEDFLDAPGGAYLQLGSLVYGCYDAGLWFVSTSARPSEDDVRAFLDVVQLEARRQLPPYASLLDFRRLEVVSDPAWQTWTEFALRNRDHQRRMLGEVVLRPETGMAASVVAGYADVIRPLHPFWVETDPRRALELLGRSDAVGLLDRVAALHAALFGTVVAKLRELMDAGDAQTLEVASKTLALSTRTLQRQLHSAGTTFQEELTRSRVRIALRLLRESKSKLAAVASEAGFANQAHMTRVIVELTGLTPSAHRRNAEQ